MRFVDSNVFIYHMADDPKYSRQASAIVRRIESGERATTSSLVISQVLSYLTWRGRAQLLPVFLGFLRSLATLEKVETTFMDFVDALPLSSGKAASSLWDDLVIAAQMRRLQTDEIYSNDTDFDSIPGVKRIFV